MSPQGSGPSQAHGQPSQPDDFGANDWLVEDMHEQYLKDPQSVDRQWRELFESEGFTPPGAPEPKAAAPARPDAPAPEAPSVPASKAAAPAPRTETGQDQPVSASAKAAGRAPAEQPVAPKQTRPAATDAKAPAAPPAPSPGFPAEEERTPLKGIAKAIAANMDASLEVPTATSVRAVPAKLLIDNRIVINNHLARAKGGKVSFTHLIGYAVVKALKQFPSQNVSYDVVDGKPTQVTHPHVNFGLAIDMPKPDGTRALVVPNIKGAEELDFKGFWKAYEDIVKRARGNKLTGADYAGTTVSLTNPGGLGTNLSVPRLSKGQACIVGVGSLEYPAPFQGTSEATLAKMGVSKILTLTSTYDHRVIQGAGSGEFLRIIHQLLLGEQGFYDEIFRSLRIPYEPIKWSQDIQADEATEALKVARVRELIHAYRDRGHLMANTNPIEFEQRSHPDLDILNHGLTLWDLDREWPVDGFSGRQTMKLRDVLGILRDSYCRTIGVEYMHIQDPAQRRWFQERLENPYAKPSREEQLRILQKLNEAEAFETFLQTKYVGQKRFSLEGGESLIPLLDKILQDSADTGLEEVAIGMAHRGRLNVLTNIAGKTYGQVFREFEGSVDPRSVQGSGDVKYHLGTEGEFTSDRGNTTKVYLAANPSHLEAVNPVLEGIVRAKQDRFELAGHDRKHPVLPILIHGDAAFAGQGVVAETLNLSQLRGYRTGGTVHVVVNNQVGFTTAPSSSRSSTYCTDVAKMIQAPVFHVNGDDPEAVVHVAELAFEYREAFNRDVVIDLVCYRRRGHNEGDDPSMTQPIMYNHIEQKKSVRTLYNEALIGRGDITEDEAQQSQENFQRRLEQAFSETHEAQSGQGSAAQDLGQPAAQRDLEGAGESAGSTGVDLSTLRHIGEAHVNIPEGFTVHPKLRQLLEKRAEMAREGGIDWGFGEILALGSLSMEGMAVRMAGQDSRRGTFVQRQAVFHDRENGQEWTPLANLSEDQGPLWIYDSLLSEYAAMGFEYGYSVERPDALVLWEAQFGDFANGAQTVVDEFISSAEQKWGQHSSVVLLLPHGYEGQGPDHSSGRIERYLQLCAEDNMTVAQPSTPASYFHLLRRQARQRPSRPLVVFTPKSMLRLKAAASAVEDFTTGAFQPVLGDTEAKGARRILLCSGKVYYDLAAARRKAGDEETAIVRLEQLYPLPVEEIRAEIARHPDAELVWVQEEPANQGAWPTLLLDLVPHLDRTLVVASRPASAATSTGSAKTHQREQATLLGGLFGERN